MKCPFCEDADSKVTVRDTRITVAGYQHYYDEAGNYHSHDSSLLTTAYSCSRMHRWEDTVGTSCACGWSGGELQRVRLD